LTQVHLYKESEIRNYEIYHLYLIVHKRAMKRGLSSKEANDEAYSAIELRYCISRGRAENIIYAQERKSDPMMYNLMVLRRDMLSDLLDEIKDEI